MAVSLRVVMPIWFEQGCFDFEGCFNFVGNILQLVKQELGCRGGLYSVIDEGSPIPEPGVLPVMDMDLSQFLGV